MLLPMTLPRAMSDLPPSPAWTVTASSGALVPNATTVRPTTRGVTPKTVARRAAPRTRISAPAMRRPAPRAKRISVVVSIPLQRQEKNHHDATRRGGLAICHRRAGGVAPY